MKLGLHRISGLLHPLSGRFRLPDIRPYIWLEKKTDLNQKQKTNKIIKNKKLRILEDKFYINSSAGYRISGKKNRPDIWRLNIRSIQNPVQPWMQEKLNRY